MPFGWEVAKDRTFIYPGGLSDGLSRSTPEHPETQEPISGKNLGGCLQDLSPPDLRFQRLGPP
ncbi:MAG: hypothetical protein NZ572_04725 [Thermoflexus sp.]|nr:hypothetical protein [Thermoflexus sp.]